MTWNDWADEAAMTGNQIYVNGDRGPGSSMDNSEDLWGVIDSTATAKTTITSPTAGQKVAVDPVNGRGLPIQLSWNAIGDGQGQIKRWDISIYDKAAGSTTATSIKNFSVTSTTSPAVLSNNLAGWPVLMPNTTYVMKIRGDMTVGGTNLNTKWSDTVEFTVDSGTQVLQNYAGPQILGPAGGATTSSNPGFAWAPVSGATSYEFILSTDPALTKTVAGTPVKLSKTSFQATGLEYGTTYFWAVMVVAPTTGTQTIGTFAVEGEPAEPAPPTEPIVIPPQPAPEITVEVPPQESAIPAVAIWVVIGVGALLIIAVLVLIVRTRRPV